MLKSQRRSGFSHCKAAEKVQKKKNEDQLNALLILCPHTELQYDCELAEKRAWLLHSDENLEQYKRLLTCVNGE